MISMFTKRSKDEEQTLNKPKFTKGDIGFTLKDTEKVLILKQLDDGSCERNGDLGPSYLVRGEKQFCFKLYECEIQTLDEIAKK